MAVQYVDCRSLREEVLEQHDLIIVSNRGPLSIQAVSDGKYKHQRSGGGLVTALLGLAQRVPSTWIACATTDDERAWKEGLVDLAETSGTSGTNNGFEIGPSHLVSPVLIRFVTPEVETYEAYYQKISNPLLWFLQHSIWDFSSSPNIDRSTWHAWNEGYVAVNWLFAKSVADQIRHNSQPSLVMFQDYHLYLAPRFVRNQLRRSRGRGAKKAVLTHFIHIPWPGPEDWSLLPKQMRESILDGLCALDLVGFQTKGDALNFIRTCESLLPGVRVNYRQGRVMLHNHVTHVRDFPISIDVTALRETCLSEEVNQFHAQFAELFGDRQAIVRIDRTEPSKNIVRGFQAYAEMLETHPEYQGSVQFLALLVPSRLDVEEYKSYLDAIMASAGQVNARFGTSDWEPVRLMVGESYPRALAALQLYDVLLVNPVADGMNLVAKEGPIINQKDGVMVLSERAGALQQLGDNALVIAPCDISATAEALHQALSMPDIERRRRSQELRRKVESEDIHLWLCWQLDAIQELMHWNVETMKVT